VFKDFCDSKRVTMRVEEFPWLILPKLMRAAEDLHTEMSERRAQRKNERKPDAPRKKGKKKHGSLRVTDPW